MKEKNYFYGPVPSRRLGFSLGVDLSREKSCTLDCVYCQVGKTIRKTTRRLSCVDLTALKKELKTIVDKKIKIDYITISGSGEPTLHKNIDKIILAIKKVTKSKYPICLITNSTLLYRKDVRREISGVDLIVPSLDAVTSRVFSKVNAPALGITSEKVIDGIVKLRKEFKGQIWLEVMLVKGINDSIEEAKKIKEAIEKIKPDKVQLNLPIRPSMAKVELPTKKRIEEIKKIISKASQVSVATYLKEQKSSDNLTSAIVKFLKRRPGNLDDLTKSLGNKNDIKLTLIKLIKEGMVSKKTQHKKTYYIVND